MRGALAISEEVRRRGLKIAVVGIPKTIDNDISYVQMSFGFETAVSEARRVTNAAHSEAEGARNGIGLVKLMGRESGFISAYASLADTQVNFCLVPEVPFGLETFLNAKSSFDAVDSAVKQTAVQILTLDRVLARYGSETDEIRKGLQRAVGARIDTIWPQDSSKPANRSDALGSRVAG